jgi:hypothetical protein
VNWQRQPKGCATESSTNDGTITMAALNPRKLPISISEFKNIRGVIGVGVQFVE